MKRPIIAGVLGLAFAGCAHTRTDVAQDPGGQKTQRPVALEPIPSIYETINRGTGSPALAQTAVRDPKDPRWSGRAPASGVGGPGRVAPPAHGPSEAPAQMAATAPAANAPEHRPPTEEALTGPVGAPASEPADPGPPPAGLPAAMPEALPSRMASSGAPADTAPLDRLAESPDLKAAAAAAAAGMPARLSSAADPSRGSTRPAPAADPVSAARVTDNPGPTPGGSPITGIPYSLPRPGGPMPEMLRRPAHGATSEPPPAASTTAVPAGPGRASDPSAVPSMNGLEPVGEPPAGSSMAATPAPAPADAAVSPSAGAAEEPKAAPGRDPLLGPNPDLMPELPPLPNDAGTAPANAPSPKPAPGPADLPPLGPVDPPPPGGDLPPLPADPGAPGGPSADNRTPARPSISLADLPPVQPVVRLQSASANDSAPGGSAPSPARRAPRRDTQIVRASHEQPADDPAAVAIPATYRYAGMVAAKVGDETITTHDLGAVVSENCHRRNIPFNQLPPEQKDMVCGRVMDELLNQSLLIQEAKRTIKEAKMYDKFLAEAERFWREDQLPKLEIEFTADNEQQLRERLRERGRSLETISRMTRREWMAEAFLRAKLRDKVKVELPELLRYYNEHLRDREFDRPAQITWREIVVETSPQATREQARRKIESIHQALRRGGDFAAIARAQSEGPSKSREEGGLMQTSPGSYGVPAVNEALDALPIGKISGILEGPSSFHIVRVDARRAAGPAAFDELQDLIKNAIFEKKFQEHRVAYIRKLRDETCVTTFLGEDKPQIRRVSR